MCLPSGGGSRYLLRLTYCVGSVRWPSFTSNPSAANLVHVWTFHFRPLSSPVVRTLRSKRETMLLTLRRHQRADGPLELNAPIWLR